jgi:hypothetical protein
MILREKRSRGKTEGVCPLRPLQGEPPECGP